MMMMMMSAAQKGPQFLALPVPPEVGLNKRLAALPDAQSHKLWAAQHRRQVISAAQNALGNFLAGAPLPAGSQVYVAPAFYTEPARQLKAGYNLAAFARRTGTQETTFPEELPRAGQANPELLRRLAIAQLVPNFSHFRAVTGAAGTLQECQPVFVEPLKPGTLLVAENQGQVHDPKETFSLVRRGEFSLSRIGLKQTNAPLLAVPDQVRGYVAQVALVQRLMHEVFSHKFGRDFARGTHSLGHNNFYQWWIEVNGGRTLTHEHLPLYAENGGPYTDVPCGRSGWLVSAETMAFHCSYMARLAADTMPEYAEARQFVNRLPRSWQRLESFLQQSRPDVLHRLHQLDEKYNLAEALDTFALGRELLVDQLDQPKACISQLQRFYQEVVGKDGAIVPHLTANALATDIYHALGRETMGLPVSFDQLDEVLKQAGVPMSQDFTPRTIMEAALAADEQELGYWDYRKYLDPNQHGTLPDYWVKLTVPYDQRFVKSILDEACLSLGRRREELGGSDTLFADEFILSDENGASYWLYPEGLTREEAKERLTLYRLDIVNDQLDGKCLIILHRGEERKANVEFPVRK